MTKKYINEWVEVTLPVIQVEHSQFTKGIVEDFITSTISLGVNFGHMIDDSDLHNNVDAIIDGLNQKIDSQFNIISFFAQSFKETLPQIVSKKQSSLTQKQQYPSGRAPK